MGTTWSVKTGARPDSVPAGRLEREMEGVLARVDAHMSTYRADSELSRFNRAERTDWIPVSTETALVVGEALRVAELSSGAFDPTVAPLVELWGFEPHPNPAIPPSRAKIAAALERVGHRLVEVREAPPALRKRRPDVALDLSGIAKGYAVDALAEELAALGFPDFLVELGGELRAAGRGPDRRHWRIGIERPLGGRGPMQAAVAVDGVGIATSGHSRNFVARDGVRYSHILDPRTGEPVPQVVASVSVMAATAMRADALATALAVLGPEPGMALARRERLAVLFLLATPSGLVEQSTPEFDRHRVRLGGPD